jgi:hypothetical protein
MNKLGKTENGKQIRTEGKQDTSKKQQDAIYVLPLLSKQTLRIKLKNNFSTVSVENF